MIKFIPLFAFIILGVIFAKNWLVKPSPRIAKTRRGFRIFVFILICWIGTFVASSLGRNLGSHENDGIAYDEGLEVPYDVMYDGVGDNVVNLFFGWSAGYIFWGIASLFWKPKSKHTET